MLDFFSCEDTEDFVRNYDFRGIEPFTLVAVEQSPILQLAEIKWDGVQLYHNKLEPEAAHSWSSVTLYSNEVIRERQRWFEEWQQEHPLFEGEDVLDFHSFGGKGDVENDLIINRNNELRTVSITQIQKTTEQFLINYWDRLNDQHYRYRIFDSEKVGC